MAKKKNPLVFMDVSIDGDPAERMLFPDIAPKTAENFRALCTGEKGIGPKTGKPLHYKGSFFHRVMKGSLAQGGDFVRRDGTSGESIYDGKFPDESPRLKHDGPGLLSMAIADRDTVGSQFVITFKANHDLDRKYIVFGQLIQGNEVLKKIENVGDEEGIPTVTVKIINCGEVIEDKRKNKLRTGKDASSGANNYEV
ncbi:Peptidyl-prolyl cis-trans isomerase cyp5 [Gossypium arboreum]|uniref:Peptidyl-prolyl cis-trans isomerase n=1 Tax=Gossypium arboreum TaxID=29729 RepID=A0A0B0PV27_GOSAR|nr:Peptidyl-prolyl cis-trans isomerase cyp5 [Gossypium arboreum]